MATGRLIRHGHVAENCRLGAVGVGHLAELLAVEQAVDVELGGDRRDDCETKDFTDSGSKPHAPPL